MTKNTTEKYFENLHSEDLEILEEMGKFQLSTKLNQEDIDT